MVKSLLRLTVLFVFCLACQDGAEPMDTEKKLADLRKQMVEKQIRARGVKDPRVLDALIRVERHHFVPQGLEIAAYDDTPLSIGEGQTISQPYIVALMTELAKVQPASKVLEVGTGSGYQAAVLAVLAKEVFTIEIIPSLGNQAKEKLKTLGYENVHVRVGDGYQGWPEEAPFDAILVTAAPDHVPQPLVDQLKMGGRLVIPLGDFYQDLAVLTKTEKGVNQEKIIPVRFVPMTGEAEEKKD
ncbi:protein-L-isoaspartate(D-aspartate) O-methyltransferase [bacterium]|nr:protein-L-isoaspartate(D-aspartate) O-methyltransferase [bacterium]MCI0606469.1 protein-L-isoaspartate(D-aspartate) O-methyltransferase [bacterium]